MERPLPPPLSGHATKKGLFCRFLTDGLKHEQSGNRNNNPINLVCLLPPFIYTWMHLQTLYLNQTKVFRKRREKKLKWKTSKKHIYVFSNFSNSEICMQHAKLYFCQILLFHSFECKSKYYSLQNCSAKVFIKRAETLLPKTTFPH